MLMSEPDFRSTIRISGLSLGQFFFFFLIANFAGDSPLHQIRKWLFPLNSVVANSENIVIYFCTSTRAVRAQRYQVWCEELCNQMT